MQIRTVGVLGCGLMGSGIAQVCAQAGYTTLVRDVSESLLQAGIGRIETFLSGGVKKGKVTAEARERTLANVSGTTRVDDLAHCDLIIEAVVESLDVKRQAFQAVEAVVGEYVNLLSNTSSLCITELAAATKRAGPLRRATFLQPGADHEVSRGDPWARDERRDISADVQLCSIPRQRADYSSRSPGLHREPPAHSLPVECDARVRERARNARGHRQEHDARLRTPDGTVYACGFRRFGYGVLHRETSCSRSFATQHTRRRRS